MLELSHDIVTTVYQNVIDLGYYFINVAGDLLRFAANAANSVVGWGSQALNIVTSR